MNGPSQRQLLLAGKMLDAVEELLRFRFNADPEVEGERCRKRKSRWDNGDRTPR